MDPQSDAQKTKADWKKIISEIDGNGDGQISYEEFCSLMKELILGHSEVEENRK